MSQDTSKDSTLFLDNLAAYRTSLIEAELSMQGEYDKSTLALSGGGLGVSFAYLKDVLSAAPTQHRWILLAAWTVWGLSIASTLLSFGTSLRAIRRAIVEVDRRTIYLSDAKSFWALATRWFNWMAGIFFIVGLGLLIAFVILNPPK